MHRHIFAYGSLMFPEVWERVVRGRYRSVAASVAGHARFEVMDSTYPGMIACPGSTVAGVVYFDVDAPDIAALDAFEGTEYRRDALQAQLAGGELVEVHTYIHLLPANLSDRPWRPEAFQMQRFMETWCRDKLGD